MRYKINNSWSVSFLLCFLALVAISSCEKNNVPKGVPHHIQELNPSIQDIKDIYSYFDGNDAELNFDTGFKKMVISGTVISDGDWGNQPAKGYFVIQNESEKTYQGIAFLLADSTADVPLEPGDLVDVNVINGTLTKRNGNFIIKGIRLSDITKLGADTADAHVVSLQTLSDNFDVYHETLVEVKLAELVPPPVAGDTYGGRKALSDPGTDLSDVVLYTFPDSGLDTVKAESNATYAGIAMYGLGTNGQLEKQIWLRNKTDIKENNIYAVNAPIVITGFLANPNGADDPKAGSSSGGVVHAGGYEYMQFMALEDIDFSKTPYSVVTCNNGTVQPDGWAAGGASTFKFDLTEGTAKAGTFFYVGGPSKVIDGYWSAANGGLSTDISDANWIRSIVINNGDNSTIAGDGFGNSTGALLGNAAPADGIAVFEGTDVTATSVPVDAVFFNAPVGTALDVGNGYLIPNNDFYSQKNPVTGVDQLLFGEGTNTYAVPVDASGGGSVQNKWTAMGGLVYKKGWIVKRSPTYKQLDGFSQLSDIESGIGITQFSN